jgi:hypothetical protein
MPCGCGTDYYNRWRRKPQTQVGQIVGLTAIQQVVDECMLAIQDLPPDLRDYVLHAIYAPYVTPDTILWVASVLRQCPDDSGLKQKCMYVAACLQQMGYSRQNLDQWTRTARGF